jgi:hypothetical protein
VYRLVTDNSLEKKIYDRQINKQGMADRVVDELNPDAHLSSKEVHSLICEEDEDPPALDMAGHVAQHRDPVIQHLMLRLGHLLTRLPIAHESLLVDRKDQQLSRAEKKIAERAYKLERTSQITYSRPSYAAFYPKQGTFATNLHNPGSHGYTRNRYYENGKRLDSWMPSSYLSTSTTVATSSVGGAGSRPVASVRPMQSELERLANMPWSGVVAPGGGGGGGPPLPAALPLQQQVRPAASYSSSSSGYSSAAGMMDGLVDTAFPTPTFSNVLNGNTCAQSSASLRHHHHRSSESHDWKRPPDDSGSSSSGSERSVIQLVTSKARAHNSHPPSSAGSSHSSSLSAGDRPPQPAGTPTFNTSSALAALSKQGVGLQEITVSRDLAIPTSGTEPPIVLKKGDQVMVIKTSKGIYLRMGDKIIKIKQPAAMQGLLGGGGAGSSAQTSKEASSCSESEASSLCLPDGLSR